MSTAASSYRPITFEGHVLPSSVMGVSTLEAMVPEMSEATAGWLFGFTVCRGVRKSATAALCHESAVEALNLMLEHHAAILESIADNLGFLKQAAEDIYAEWAAAFQLIAEVSGSRDRDSDSLCYWSAPVHPEDRYQSAEEAYNAINAFLDLCEKDMPSDDDQ